MYFLSLVNAFHYLLFVEPFIHHPKYSPPQPLFSFHRTDGGRHSWLRRAMPRSDLTYGSSSSFMEAAQPVLPLMGGYMGGNGYAAGGGGSVPALGGEGGMSPVEYGAWMAQHFAGQV